MKNFKTIFFIAIIFFSILHNAMAARGFGVGFGTGTSDIISSGNTITYPTQISISCWFYITGTPPPSRIFSFNADLPVLNANSYAAGFSTTNGNWTWPLPSFSVWHNLVLIYDASSFLNIPIVYVDGISQTVTTAVAPVGTFVSNTGIMYIGNRQSDHARGFQGVIGQIAWWGGTLLTANEGTSLSSGASPLKIRNSSLLMYAPLYGQLVNEINFISPYSAMTVSGALFHVSPPNQPYPNIKYSQ